jgi:hypothetical protein
VGQYNALVKDRQHGHDGASANVTLVDERMELRI